MRMFISKGEKKLSTLSLESKLIGLETCGEQVLPVCKVCLKGQPHEMDIFFKIFKLNPTFYYDIYIIFKWIFLVIFKLTIAA